MHLSVRVNYLDSVSDFFVSSKRVSPFGNGSTFLGTNDFELVWGSVDTSKIGCVRTDNLY